MMQSNELFTDRDREEIYAFFQTRDRWRDIVRWRTLEHGPVDTVFYGDSIFELWPTAEAFPELSHLNRGIGGDNINGLYFRLDEDIFPNSPRQVVINIGINGRLHRGRISRSRLCFRSKTGISSRFRILSGLVDGVLAGLTEPPTTNHQNCRNNNNGDNRNNHIRIHGSSLKSATDTPLISARAGNGAIHGA